VHAEPGHAVACHLFEEGVPEEVRLSA